MLSRAEADLPQEKTVLSSALRATAEAMQIWNSRASRSPCLVCKRFPEGTPFSEGRGNTRSSAVNIDRTTAFNCQISDAQALFSLIIPPELYTCGSVLERRWVCLVLLFWWTNILWGTSLSPKENISLFGPERELSNSKHCWACRSGGEFLVSLLSSNVGEIFWAGLPYIRESCMNLKVSLGETVAPNWIIRTQQRQFETVAPDWIIPTQQRQFETVAPNWIIPTQQRQFETVAPNWIIPTQQRQFETVAPSWIIPTQQRQFETVAPNWIIPTQQRQFETVAPNWIIPTQQRQFETVAPNWIIPTQQRQFETVAPNWIIPTQQRQFETVASNWIIPTQQRQFELLLLTG